jgi:hypothetical protein
MSAPSFACDSAAAGLAVIRPGAVIADTLRDAM